LASTDGARSWRCECGWAAVENGDGRAVGQALNHRRAHKKASEAYAIIGLVDTATGELLVKGLNPTGAVRGGYLPDMTPPPPPPPRRRSSENQPAPSRRRASPAEQASDESGAEAPPAKDVAPRAPRSPNPAVAPNTVRAVIQAWQIAVPASIWGWFSIGRGRLRRDDGSEYEATPQGLSDYTWDVFADWHEKHLGVILGLTPRQQADPEVTKRLDQVVQAIRSMTPEDAVQRFGAPAVPPGAA
jgi:hypothetical protein